MKNWYLIIDGLSRHNPTTIAGVLGGTRDIVIAKNIRRGIMDSYFITTSEEFDAESPACTGYRWRRFCELPEEKMSEAFLQKRELVRIRMRGFELWRSLLSWAIENQIDYPSESTLLFLNLEIQKSTIEKPSDGLVDYAHVAGVPVGEVYEYLRLYIDEHANKRIVIHALAERFVREINACTTEEEIDVVCTRMRDEFYGKNIS